MAVVQRKEQTAFTEQWMNVALRPDVYSDAPVQAKTGGTAGNDFSAVARGGSLTSGDDIHAAATHGIQGSGGALPFGDQIQRSFGSHDISGVQAHTGSAATEASQAMGATAYATGNDIAFAGTPDLHTAAHEAAHIQQQRAGVSLSDGVGRAGDMYERHADAVADAVVRGDSAEGLLDQTTGGSSGVQRKAVQRDGGDEEAEVCEVPEAAQGDGWTIDQLLDGIQANYRYQLETRRNTLVEDFAQAADDVDEPPFWQSLLVTCAEIALSAVTAGIGGAVARACVSAAAKTTADMVKKAVADAIKAGISGAISAAAGGSSNPLEIFIRGQRQMLVDAEHAQETALIDQSEAYRTSPTGQQDALDLYNAQEQEECNIRQRQFNETLAQWCVYQARGESGTDREGEEHEGTDLGDQVGDTSGKGVLGLRVEAFDSRTPVQIIDAEIEGLNDNLRRNLSGRRIGVLGIPITVHGEVFLTGSALVDAFSDSRGHMRFGENEAGTVWDDSNFGGLDWMYRHLHPNEDYIAGPGQRLGPSYDRMRAARFEAARHILDNEIKPMTLDHLGVELVG